MSISILKKYILFSNKPGTKLLVPSTSFMVALFPTRILLEDLESKASKEIIIDTQGPIDKFEVRLDLEKNRIEFSGKSSLGFFRFHIFQENNSIHLLLKKGPLKGFCLNDSTVIKPNEPLTLIHNIKTSVKPFEKLSLGSHKALELSKIEDRKDLKELVPILFSLYQKIHSSSKSHREGTAKLLDFPKEKVALEKQFLALYAYGFNGIVPTLTDNYQGYVSSSEKVSNDASPLVLLKEFGKKVRSLFIRQENNTFYLLETLLRPFASGRMINIDTDYGIFNLQWSEKTLRKVIFQSKVDDQIAIVPQKQVKSFRLKTSRKDKGITLKPRDLFSIKKNQTVYLDRFER